MISSLIYVHIVIAFLLIFVILIQRTAADGLSGLSNGNGMPGLISRQAANNFLYKVTIVLALLFVINSLIIGNLSSKTNITDKNLKVEKTIPLIEDVDDVEDMDNVGKSSEGEGIDISTSGSKSDDVSDSKNVD